MKFNLALIVATVIIGSAGAASAETYVGNSSSYSRKTVTGRVNFSGTSYENGVNRFESGAIQGEYKFNGNGNKGNFEGSYSLEAGRDVYGSRTSFNGYESYQGYEGGSDNDTYAGIR